MKELPASVHEEVALRLNKVKIIDCSSRKQALTPMGLHLAADFILCSFLDTPTSPCPCSCPKVRVNCCYDISHFALCIWDDLAEPASQTCLVVCL